MSSRSIPAPATATLAFLTLIDLFATQAILPSLARKYMSSPMATGFAVNSTTIGMAAASLAVAFFSARLDRRAGIVVSLCILAIPTFLLAFAPDLTIFAGLRIVQGLCMACAFALTLAYLGEHVAPQFVAGAFAAYVTGNVASNLFGRLAAAALVLHFGVSGAFVGFSVLNLLGAVLAFVFIEATPRRAQEAPAMIDIVGNWMRLVGSPQLRAAFGVGFCILFAFVGAFTYVNFVLAAPPIGLGMMQIGLVYFVFGPSIVTTPLAGRVVTALGVRGAMWTGLGIALIGAAALLYRDLVTMLAGLALLGIGTFLAQAVTTGFVGRSAMGNSGGAGGFYLASYFAGGLVGAWALGLLFDNFGWTACVFGFGAALVVAAALATQFVAAPAGGVAPAPLKGKTA